MRRRDFLRIGLGAAAGPVVLAAQEPARKPTSVVWLWMSGGPRPDLGDAGRFPLCAAQAKHLAIFRSVTVDLDVPARAAEQIRTGSIPYPRAAFASAGMILAYECGNKKKGFSRYVAIDVPEAPAFPGFLPEDHPYGVKDVDRPFPWNRAEGRGAELLDDLNAGWGPPLPALRPPPEAFDLRGEPEALRAAYGGRFGRGCLVARRLVEAGCPFVEVGLSGWEDPARVNGLSAELDAGLGTLVRDLEARGRLKDTLVVCAGEPSPAKAFSAALAGGPIQGGRVREQPVRPEVFLSTIYKACGITRGTYIGDGHRWPYLRKWPKPVEELF